MMHTENSGCWPIASRTRGADLPDANRGFLGQYPELFADHITEFLG